MLRLKRDREGMPGFYVVALEDGRHVGRIFKSNSAPRDAPWFWTLDWLSRRGPGPHQGNAATREDAMKAFRAAWDAS